MTGELLFSKIFEFPSEQGIRSFSERIEASADLRRMLDRLLLYRLSVSVGERWFDIYLADLPSALEITDGLAPHAEACGGMRVEDVRLSQALTLYAFQKWQRLAGKGHVKGGISLVSGNVH